MLVGGQHELLLEFPARVPVDSDPGGFPAGQLRGRHVAAETPAEPLVVAAARIGCPVNMVAGPPDQPRQVIDAESEMLAGHLPVIGAGELVELRARVAAAGGDDCAADRPGLQPPGGYGFPAGNDGQGLGMVLNPSARYMTA